MLWIGGLRPRQIHGSLVVLLRDGRPANAATVSARRPKAALLPAGLTVRSRQKYLGGACVMIGGPFCMLPWL